MKKRLFSLILSVLMLASMLPMTSTARQIGGGGETFFALF